MRFGALALAALAAAPILAQGPSPVGDDQTRWWTHVKTLADDGFEGRQTGTDGYRKAAAYVAAQFERAGLKPAGTKGYLQPVQFTRRRIVEAQSQVALVRRRHRQEDVLRFGDDVTISLRAELAPTVEAPLVFAGYGLSAPDAGHDDLAGLDLKGKVVVYISGTPAEITGALARTISRRASAGGAQGRRCDRRASPSPTRRPWNSRGSGRRRAA